MSDIQRRLKVEDILQKIASNLYDGEDQEVAELVQEALDQGLEPGEILRGASSPAWTRCRQGL